MLFSAPLVIAQPAENSNKLVEYLAQEKIKLSVAINEAKLIAPPVDELAYQKQRQENDAMMAMNHAKIASLEGFLANQKQIQTDLVQRLKHLQQASLTQVTQGNAQEQIGKMTTLSAVNRKTIELINEDLVLANRYQERLLAVKQQLDLWEAKQHMNQQLKQLREQEARLNDSLNHLYESNIKLQQDVKVGTNFNNTYLTEAKLLLNNQIINLTQYKVAEIDLQKKLVKADYSLRKDPDVKTLQKVAETYKESVTKLVSIEQALKQMITILTEEQPRVPDESLKQQFGSLLTIINSRLEGIAIQQQTLQEDLENHQEELKKQLSTRQSLSEYRFNSWPNIIEQLFHIPAQFYQYLKSLVLKVKENYLWQEVFPTAIMWSILALIFICAYGLHRLLKYLTSDKERSRLSGHLYDGVLNMLSRNILHIAIPAALVTVLHLNHLLFSSYQLLFDLMMVWLTFRILILIARLTLLERISDVSGSDVRLYYRIKWLLLAGGWATALMVISHLLPLSLIIQDIFNRLFMLFLLAVSIVGWKSREVITHLLEPGLKTKKRYLQHATMLLVELIPLTLFITAVIGLVGYINLAWSMSRYEVELLLVMIGYVLIRGLLVDALELLSEWMISSMGNGWLWIEVFLKPLDKIFRLLLLGLSFFILCELYGWHSDSFVIRHLIQFGAYPLIDVMGIHITPSSIIQFVICLSIFIWMAKWTREFGYRWLYREARDTGIRNSLAVFTQYAVILVGSFITLRVLGLDLSGMSMVVGGLAVGMGFGLRDFASNIVGGLMLLIERPVREGDLITLGNFEGRVAHIGIRSMRVSSWDNTEVLVPNAETFNKPFINWTHQDSIVRTVIPIKISRSDDPLLVQQLMFEVLHSIPEIVSNPPAQVFLKQIDEALILFEMRYFINVQLHTRFEVRSKVLFALTARFKEAKVQPPIPPIQIELKEDRGRIIPSDPRSVD
ncbi:MAG: mechanosensitive ion channel [Legionella sp.]|nr:mechanosensitive ion channel [Legionella sp.]